MIRRIFVTALAAALAADLLVPAALAQFNTKALKNMQQEGHKIVEDAKEAEATKAARMYKLGNNLCLDSQGNGLAVRACNNEKASQKWRLDDQRRLVASSGQCLTGAQLRQCGALKTQYWKQDGRKRLVNDNKQCLQGQGTPIKAGAKVIAVKCSNAANQVWR